jgi:putative phage-type endonuclease
MAVYEVSQAMRMRGVWLMTEYVDTKTIGGSDVGALLGLNPYSSPQAIYERLVDPKPRHGSSDDDDPNKRRGKKMEPIIADEYEYKTSRKVAETERKFHPDIPFVHASMDRIIVTSEHNDPTRAHREGPGALEIKCHNAWVFKQAMEEGVNPSYYAQLQHYLWVTGWQWGGFALFNADAWHLHEFDVDRDDAFISRIEDTVLTFWNKHVLTRTPPNGQAVAPVEIAAKKRGQSTEWVKRNDPTWIATVDRYRIANDAFTVAKTSLEMCKKEIQSLMGDATKVAGGGVRVQLSEGTTSTLDKEALAAAYPAIDLAQFTRKTAKTSFLTTWERGG